jgi:integrase
VSYGIAINSFAESQGKSADVLVQEIKAGRLDLYRALDKYVADLDAQLLAPKTIHGYVSSERGLLKYEGVALDNYQMKTKVGLPPRIESSLDRIPTREELRLLVLNANPRTRALISLLATSGPRIGEAAGLRVGNVDFEKCQISVVAARTKSRATRLTLISTETVKFLRDYLKKHVEDKDSWLFPNDDDPKKSATRGELYQTIRRTLIKVGL